MAKKDKKEKDMANDPVIKKIIKMYQNYGLDLTDMNEMEFERIKELYRSSKENLDRDLKESEKYKDVFENDIV